MWGATVPPFLGLFFGLWIMHIDPSFIHSYTTVVKKIPHESTEIGSKWLLKQVLDHASDQH
jgi:hypothetical protein